MSRFIERLDKLKIDRRYIIRDTEIKEIYNTVSEDVFYLVYYGFKLGYLRGIQKAKRDAKKALHPLPQIQGNKNGA